MPHAVCGNGIVEESEASGDGCDATCAFEKRQVRMMIWNVQVERLHWGSSALEPRSCQALRAARCAALPELIALQEFSPSWHAKANFDCLRQLGCALAIDAAGLRPENAFAAIDIDALLDAGTQPVARL